MLNKFLSFLFVGFFRFNLQTLLKRVFAHEKSDERAKELHELLDKRSQNSSTTSVGNTLEEKAIIGTSDKYLRKVIKEALLEHEIIAESSPNSHAEINVINKAETLNLTLTEIGSSRPICLDCENTLKSKNIAAKSSFSGKKSKKRK